MERFEQLSNYFNQRQRRRLAARQDGALPTMTEEEIVLTCLENNGYETPELNDKLYLHFRGFRRIENLQRYTGVKSLWLDSNGLEEMEGLDALTQLRCLYLSKNLISRVAGVAALTQLTVLDLSHNRVTRLDGVDACVALQTLNVAHNALAGVDALAPLRRCTALTNLDITHNRLDADDAFLRLFADVPALVALSVSGNALTQLPAFRKRLLCAAPRLGYLDRPVDAQERRFAQAFVAGGSDAEARERQAWRDEQRVARERQMAEFRDWQRQRQAQRATAPTITAWSAEEAAQRAAEAAAAAEAERRVLALGVDQLATRFWRLSADAQRRDVDVLDLAAQQLLEEAAPAESPRDGDAAPAETTPDAPRDADAAPAETAPAETTPGDADAARAEAAPAAPPSEANATPAPEHSADGESAEDEAQRAERVRLSLEMYKQQRSQAPAPPRAVSDTWGEVECKATAAPPPVFWTEDMDMQLAMQVKQCVFDFAAIAEALRSQALRAPQLWPQPQQLSADACRLRWAELDARQWSEPAPGTSAQDTLFRINVREEVLQHFQGQQPSYEALAAMIAGQKPRYLAAPQHLPSTADYDEEEDEPERS